MIQSEAQLEQQFLDKLKELKYTYRSDIRDLDSLEKNFREKFERLNYVTLSDGEFRKLLQENVTADVFTAAKNLRQKQTFVRDDGTTFDYSLVNLRDWCKNEYEVVSQLTINTANSRHRYDIIILINGLPLVQIELKRHSVSPLLTTTTSISSSTPPTIICRCIMLPTARTTRSFSFSSLPT